MFANQTVLLMRGLPSPSGASSSTFQFRRRYHATKNVMEVKAYLTRCIRRPGSCAVPAAILIDAGERNRDIQSELQHWLSRHPRLWHVKIFVPRAGIGLRLWKLVTNLWKRCVRQGVAVVR
jgi:hypothetical protein